MGNFYSYNEWQLLMGEAKDEEYSMARSELSTALNAIQRLKKRLKGEGQLEAWVQSKITKASDYLRSASDYIDSGESDVTEERMTAGDIKREEELKKKYDPSGMKESMIERYGKKKGTQIYFATIRKQAMEAYEINEMQNQEVEDDDEAETQALQPKHRVQQQTNPQEYLNQLAKKRRQAKIAKQAKDVADAIESGELSDSFIYEQLFNESRGTGAARLASFLSRTGRGSSRATRQEIEGYKAAAKASQEPIPEPKERQKRIGIGALPSRGVGPEEKLLRGGYARTPKGIAKRRATELKKRARDPNRSTADVLRDLERAGGIENALKNKEHWGEELQYILEYLVNEALLDEAKLSRAERRSRNAGRRGYDAQGRPVARGGIHAFDVDETIFSHGVKGKPNVKIHLDDESGKRVASLTNQEFNTHKLPKGHSYDFNEFMRAKTFSQTASPNKSVIRRIQKLQRRGKNVHLITARDKFDSPEEFRQHFERHGIKLKPGQIHYAGGMKGSDIGQKKVAIAKGLAKIGNTSSVHMYDDAAKVHKAFEAEKPKGKLKIKTHLAKPNKQGEVMTRSYQATKSEEFELWVDSLLDEGYDLSEFTVNELYEAYEVLLDEGRRDDKKPSPGSHNYKGDRPEKKGPRIDPPNYTKKGYGKYTKEEMEVELTPYEFWKSFIFEDDDYDNEIVEDYYEDEIEYEEAPMTSYDYWKAYIEDTVMEAAPMPKPTVSQTPSSQPKGVMSSDKSSANASTADKIKRGTQIYNAQRKAGDFAGASETGMGIWRTAPANTKLVANLDRKTDNPAMTRTFGYQTGNAPTQIAPGNEANGVKGPPTPGTTTASTPPTSTTPTPSTTPAARPARTVATPREINNRPGRF